MVLFAGARVMQRTHGQTPGNSKYKKKAEKQCQEYGNFLLDTQAS